MIFQVTQFNKGWTVEVVEYEEFIPNVPFKNTKGEWVVVGTLDKYGTFFTDLDDHNTVLDALHAGMKLILAGKQRKANKWRKDFGQI